MKSDPLFYILMCISIKSKEKKSISDILPVYGGATCDALKKAVLYNSIRVLQAIRIFLHNG